MEKLILQLRCEIIAAGGYMVVAERMGVTRQNLYFILRKSGNPTLHTVMKIADAVGLTLTLNKLVPLPSPVQTTETKETQ